MDSAEFHAAVYDTVRRIPPGKVTTYGHIAKLIGMPRNSRQVGKVRLSSLKFLSPDLDPPVPWQRVISSSGAISSRGPGTDGAQRQRTELEAEEVEVSDSLKVNLRTYGWFPESLPAAD
ncbi:hypothetical protein BDZ89DRAFT_1063745 [Hymenopellis radicata]|nr:hypothetical protein BDZ89DRAFT_1063745 [Hymenopellis radicata]